MMIMPTALDFDLRDILRERKRRPETQGPFRIFLESIVLFRELADNEVAAGRISTADLNSQEIQRYNESALGSSRII